MPALAVRTAHDALLGAIAPLGLAAAAGTALVVDLDSDGPDYPGSASLAELVDDGPRGSDLKPDQSGVAVLRNGGVAVRDAERVLQALVSGWPAVVLRLPMADDSQERLPGAATLSVVPLYPGLLTPDPGDRPVYQRTSFRVSPPGRGIVLPRLSPGAASRLVRGLHPGPSRWIRSWRAAWRWT